MVQSHPPVLDEELVLEAAKALAAQLREALKDIDAETVPLNRDEAAVAFGLLDGLVTILSAPPG